MKSVTSALGALCVLLFASLTQASAAPPVEAFGTLPAMSDVHLSPDGTHFSALEPVNGRPAVLVFELHPKPGTKPLIYSLEDGNAIGSMWVTNDRLVCFYYENKYLSESIGMRLEEIARAVSVSLSGKRPLMLMKGTEMYLENSTADILARSVDAPNVVYMEVNRGGGFGIRHNLYAVNVEDNNVGKVADGNVHTAQWIVDEHGHAVARVDSTGETEQPKSKDTFVVNDGGQWREAASYDNFAGSIAGIDGVTGDGNAVVVERWGDNGKRVLETLPLRAGEKPAVCSPIRTTISPAFFGMNGRVEWLVLPSSVTKWSFGTSTPRLPIFKNVLKQLCPDKRSVFRPGTRRERYIW